jgi:ABC-type multidrug transport system fused ATPase/permease subunit
MNAKMLKTDLEFLLLERFMEIWKRSCHLLQEVMFAYVLGEYFFQHPGEMGMGDFKTLTEQRGCCMGIIVWYMPYLMDIEEELNRSVDFFRIFDHAPGIDNTTGCEIPEKEIKGAITFENVSFNYPTKPAVKVLKNLSCEIKAG